MNGSSRRATSRLRAALVLVPLILFAAACGDDGESAETTSAPVATEPAPAATDAPVESTAAPVDTTAPESGRTGEPGTACVGSGDGSGEPIVIGSIQTDSSPAGQFPEITSGAEACFAAINATGGINGRPIEFKKCNDSADAVQGEKCARDLIDAGATAVLGGICFSCFSAPIVDVLGAAGVPYVGGLPVLPNEYEQENFLAITNAGGSASLYANAAYIMQTAAEKGVTANVVEVNANVGDINPTLEQRIKLLGGNYVARIDFDPASADLASVAQQAIDEKPNFVSVQTDGPNTVKIVTSLRQQGYEGDIVILGTAADPASIAGMGDASEGVYIATFFENIGAGTSPDALKFQADMKAINADPLVTLAATGYAGAFVTAEALFAVEGEITNDSFRAALLKLKGIVPLFAGQLSYENAKSDFPRTFYFTAYGNVIKGGKLESTGAVFDFYTGKSVG